VIGSERYRSFCEKYNISLNTQQEKAVQTIEGANLLLAVPGSGKTTVLVARLGYMVLCCGIEPQNILSITYTKAAAADMKARFSRLFGSKLADQLRFRTINSLCDGIIKYYEWTRSTKAFDLIDDKQRRQLLLNIYQSLSEDYPTENDLIEAETVITYIKNMMLNDEAVKEIDTDVPDILSFYKKYLSEMKLAHLMDYDDQMRYALNILLQFPDILAYYHKKYRYICVDEAQDTSKLQHTLIRLLARKNNNIFMVGDEDQSIYGFRAAYPQALMDFQKVYPNATVLYMERNYRSTQEIVGSAQKFIERNMNRHPKHMTADRERGTEIVAIPTVNRTAQYKYLLKVLQHEHGEIAVLYRDNECAVPLIDLLIRNDIPYYTPKSQMIFFTSKPVMDMICFLRLIVDPYDTDAFMQIYYKCSLGFNKKTAVLACSKCRMKKIPVADALAESLSDLQSKKGRAEAFKRNLLSAGNENTYIAIHKIYDSMYKQYMLSNHMDTGKIKILKALAASEPDIKSFLSRFEKLPILIEQNIDKTEQAVILSTVHSSKGQEYDTVYIMDVFDGYLPRSVPRYNDDDKEKNEEYQEERRLFYVAMTRAKNQLFLFNIEPYYSTFIRELFPEKYCPNKLIDAESPENASRSLGYLNKHSLTQKKKTAAIPVNEIAQYTTGAIVRHKEYGKGSIRKVRTNNDKKHIVDVVFYSGVKCEFLLEYAVEHDLLSIVDKYV